MKKTVMYIVSLVLVMLIALPVGGGAQDQERLQKFSPAELDQMLAPIALYPDSLLAQVLMASTYPLEVVMADRWVKAHPHLSGDQLQAALDNQNWDPSVKALVPFPQVLAMMGEKLEWTQRLGDAFLDQQEEVMDTVQGLREKARVAGNLKSTREQRVVVKEKIIVIEPANLEIVYVPVYNPTIVYGRWWYPAYPPFWYYPPGYVVTRVVFAFPFFCIVGPAWPIVWGHWDWPRHTVYVNIDRTININRTYVSHVDVRTTTWHHDVDHRRGVPYRSVAARERYTPTRGSADTRRDFRGFNQEVKMAPKVSSKPLTTIQKPSASVSTRTSGNKVSSVPPVIQQPQRSGIRKPEPIRPSNTPTIQQPQPSGAVGSTKMSDNNRISSVPATVQQSQPSAGSISKKPDVNKVSGRPTAVQQPQPSAVSSSKRPEVNKVSSAPITVQQPQPPVASANKRPEVNKINSAPSPISQPQASRGSDSKGSASSGNRGNVVFGGMNRGSEVKQQSERVVQGRAATITRGADSGSARSAGVSGGVPSAGKVNPNGNGQQNVSKGGFGGSGQGGVAYQKDQGKEPERMADAMTKNDHAQAGRKMK